MLRIPHGATSKAIEQSEAHRPALFVHVRTALHYWFRPARRMRIPGSVPPHVGVMGVAVGRMGPVRGGVVSAATAKPWLAS